MSLNLTYAPLKPFQCIVPSQNQQNVKFLPEIVIFSGTTYCTDSKPAVLDLACLKPYICTTQAISMHCSQSKSTKCEIFVWNCNFLGTTYHGEGKILGFETLPVTLNCDPLKHCNAYVPIGNFGHFMDSPWQQTICCTGKECVIKTCKSIGFLGKLNAFYNSWTIWVINGLATFAIGRSDIGFKKQCICVKKCEIFAWNCDFLGTTYHRKPAVLDF